MSSNVIHRFTIKVYDPNQHEHWRPVDVEVVVDLAAIAKQLGAKAHKNKTGRARFMRGAVIVSAVS